VLLIEEIRENHRPIASHCQTTSHEVVSSTPPPERDSNSLYHAAITTKMGITFQNKIWVQNAILPKYVTLHETR
jgi:hypothetical protein